MSVYLVHGDKGGVGKSFLAAVLIEYLCERGSKVAVVDADARNADLHAVFSGGDFPTLQTDLREEDGWTELASFLESIPHNNVVVSLPAGVGDEVTQNRDVFRDALHDLRRSLVAFWVLNRTPHSVALLRHGAGDGRRTKLVLRRARTLRALEHVQDPRRVSERPRLGDEPR
jgi:nucleoside-diphosphate-sugar epimerase